MVGTSASYLGLEFESLYGTSCTNRSCFWFCPLLLIKVCNGTLNSYSVSSVTIITITNKGRMGNRVILQYTQENFVFSRHVPIGSGAHIDSRSVGSLESDASLQLMPKKHWKFACTRTPSLLIGCTGNFLGLLT